MTAGAITGRVTGATIVWEILFTGMVGDPLSTKIYHGIVEIELSCRFLAVSRNDIAFLIDKSRLPVITADNVADIIPPITFRWARYLGERIIGRFATFDSGQFPGMTT
jgi:hypothetical protein